MEGVSVLELVPGSALRVYSYCSQPGLVVPDSKKVNSSLRLLEMESIAGFIFKNFSIRESMGWTKAKFSQFFLA